MVRVSWKRIQAIAEKHNLKIIPAYKELNLTKETCRQIVCLKEIPGITAIKAKEGKE